MNVVKIVKYCKRYSILLNMLFIRLIYSFYCDGCDDDNTGENYFCVPFLLLCILFIGRLRNV